MEISQNKNSSKKAYALYLAVAFFFTVFSFGNSANAETVYSSLYIGETFTNSANVGPFIIQPFSSDPTFTASTPTGTGVITYDRVWVKLISGTCSNLVGDEGGTFSIAGSGTSFTSSNDLGDGICELIGPERTQAVMSIYFDEDNAFELDSSSANPGYFTTYAGTPYYLGTPAFQICNDTCDQEFLPTSYVSPTSNPRIVSFSPAIGSTTASNNVTYTVNGFAFGTSTIVWLLQNVDDDDFYTIIFPLGFQDGEFNVSTTSVYISSTTPQIVIDPETLEINTTLLGTRYTTTPNGGYIGSLTLFDVYGQNEPVNSAFRVVSSNYDGALNIASGQLLPGTSFIVSTSTSGLSENNLLSFLNIASLLKTKIPFGYVFQVGTILLNLDTATTYTIPSGTFSFKFGTATTSVDMFSTTTITRFMPSGFLTLFRGLLATIEWVGLGFYLWRRGHNLIT